MLISVAVLLVPLTLGGLLVSMGWLEEHLVSPKAMIRASVKHSTPEYAEGFVAREAERLLCRETA